MTRILYHMDGSELFLSSEGHAERTDVCTAISSLLQTLAMRIDELGAKYHYEVHDGRLWLFAKGAKIRPAFETILCGLKHLADSYPENVSLEEGCPIITRSNMG